ncbi:copper amine oxidase N-terminal domain-containing protein [Paenibacillus sp. S150]|uniref:copper amine oxidase N-terminal domain-containing protein n=1 Tax=Paenibacillus sp. S150 TaxID=2749826 RepID=UPI001C581829|nr:copper amine oxidase N-terminal domain-containing protein [Paenibacillus sp. S150]MBW4081194.1 copper amine oxidase N-terminal domain-containing protein [Paenibacillus sp. S150]
MVKKWLAAPLLAASLLMAPMTDAASTAYFRYTLENGGQSTSPALLKNGMTYVSAGLWESSGLQVSWDKAHQKAQFIGWNKKIGVRIGSTMGVLDGAAVNLGGLPFMHQDQLYVPARFLVRSLGGTPVSWNAAQSLYVAQGLQTFSSASASYGGVTYTVDKNNGILYAADAAGNPRLLAKLGSELYDMLQFDFQKTPKGLVYLTITDVYGEPHINNAWYTLILKDGAVIRQDKVRYWQRYGDNVKMYGNTLVLTDGYTLRLIEDGTGKVSAAIDMAELGGESGAYLVEGMDDDFLLIRPNQKGLLLLVERNTGKRTLLYQELLDSGQQEYAETNDIPFHGDNLKFIKREGDALLFTNEYVQDGKVYKYILTGN